MKKYVNYKIMTMFLPSMFYKIWQFSITVGVMNPTFWAHFVNYSFCGSLIQNVLPYDAWFHPVKGYRHKSFSSTYRYILG